MEQLINELNRILNYHIDHAFTLNPSFIKELIELIIESRKLEEYYSKTTISYEDSSNITTYNSLNIIKVYYNTLRHSLKIPESEIFNNLELNLYPLAMMIFYFFHEVEHVNQRRLYYSNNYNSESRVIKASRFELLPLNQFEKLSEKEKQKYLDYAEKEALKYQSYYNRYYTVVPTERMADIRAYEFLLQLLEHASYFSDIQELYSYLSKMYFLDTIKAYKIDLTPTRYYLEQTKRRLTWLKLLLFTYKLPLDERIYLGTNITKEELLSLERRKANFKLNIPS